MDHRSSLWAALLLSVLLVQSYAYAQCTATVEILNDSEQAGFGQYSFTAIATSSGPDTGVTLSVDGRDDYPYATGRLCTGQTTCQVSTSGDFGICLPRGAHTVVARPSCRLGEWGPSASYTFDVSYPPTNPTINRFEKRGTNLYAVFVDFDPGFAQTFVFQFYVMKSLGGGVFGPPEPNPLGLNHYEVRASPGDMVRVTLRACQDPPVSVEEIIPDDTPPVFQFELPTGLPSDFPIQRMLVRNHRNDNNYPSPYQIPRYPDLRPRFRFPGTVTQSGRSVSREVWLRIVDPKDSSPYVPSARPDDNDDPSPKGVLLPPGCDTASCGATSGNPLRVVSDAHGRVEVVLEGTDRYAGDNYQIEASFDQSFTCATAGPASAPNICARSGIITAHKQFFVEPDEMYRNSQLIRSNVVVGQNLVYVNERWRRGDRVRLIHAPSYLRTAAGDSAGFYFEDFEIDDIRRNPNPNIAAAFEIRLNGTVAHPYSTDLTIAGVELGDALVNLSRIAQHSTDPMLRMNRSYVIPAFGLAFVDLVTLPSNGVGVPMYDAMTETGMIFAGAKWLAAKTSSVIPPNTGLAVAAATRDPLPPPAGGGPAPLSLGTTAGPYSYVWRLNIDEATGGPRHRFPLTAGHNPDLMSGEVLVHELAHQWKVNSGYVDHECTHNSYDNPSLFCQGNGPQNSGQYDDGHVAFHYVPGATPGTADSEYVTIRTAPEPRPQ